jgi:hypothetical protein
MKHTPSMLHFFSPSQLLKLANPGGEVQPPHERGDMPPVRMNKEVAKEMGKILLTVAGGTGLGAASAYGVGAASDHYKLLDSVPKKRVAQGAAAITAVLPFLYAARHESVMDRLRKAYERGSPPQRTGSESG